MAELGTTPEPLPESAAAEGRSLSTIRWLQHHVKTLGAVITLLASIGLIIKGLLGYFDVYHVASSLVSSPHSVSAQEAASASKPNAAIEKAARLSIAVVPFQQIGSGDDNVAEAITQSISVYTSHIPGYIVKTVETSDWKRNAAKIGSAFGVNFVLKGSAQTSGKHVRINVELLDANDDTQLWTDHFEDADENILALEDVVAGRIANSLEIEVIKAAVGRLERDQAKKQDAEYFAIKGRFAFHKLRTKENLREAQGFFEKSIALNPDQPDALSYLPLALVFDLLNFPDKNRDEKAALAMQIADKAVQLSPMSGVAHGAKAQAYTPYGRYREWIQECETAISLNPNLSQPLTLLAAGRFRTGEFEKAIAAGNQAMRVSPHDPGIAFAPLHVGNSYVAIHDYDHGLKYLELVRATSPLVWRPHASLAVAYELDGNTDGAQTELAEARRLNPTLTVKSYEQTFSFKKPAVSGKEDRFIAFRDESSKALRDLGLPDK
jgi:TolB-like protein